MNTDGSMSVYFKKYIYIIIISIIKPLFPISPESIEKSICGQPFTGNLKRSPSASLD